jgi:hypothetical protein
VRRTVLALGCAVPIALHGQIAGRSNCPAVNGLTVAFSGQDSTSTPTRTSAVPGLRLDDRTVIDTTWRFDIAERRWTRPYFAASVGAGWSGGGLATGTTPAPGSSAEKGWFACAGVAIDMRDPTLLLRGVRGQVHLRADVRSLSRGGTARNDSTSQPRR